MAAADRAAEAGLSILPRHALPPPKYPDPLNSLPRSTSKRSTKRAHNAQTSTLWLPSNLPPELRKHMVLGDLTNKEIPIRIAVCIDSIHNLHSALRTRHAMCLDTRKTGHVTQSHQTCLQTSRLSLSSAVTRHAERYRRLYAALLALDPHGTFKGGEWMRMLRPLLAGDLTAPQEEESELGTISEEEEGEIPRTTGQKGRGRAGKPSEGRRERSWIWSVGRIGTDGQPFVTQTTSKKDIYKCEYCALTCLLPC